MNQSDKFRGVGVALVTPFRDSGALDEEALRRFVKWQVEQGTDFLVPCGTTGENPALTRTEHLRVVELTIEAAGGKVPVLAGAGSNSTETAIDFALEVIELTGKPFSANTAWERFESRYELRVAGLARPRDELYRRIGERVDDMLERGFVDEVRALEERGLGVTARQALGYKQ
ncbi:MAG: dihydrodipicolinate synthase family protein, partial [Acidobacteria bacterium]|nr:dihydrodipicolinate synthase family protein [Acidobacteriota bacterium]